MRRCTGMREATIDPWSCQPFPTLFLHLCHLQTIAGVSVGCCRNPPKQGFFPPDFYCLFQITVCEGLQEESIGRLILFFACQGFHSNTNLARLPTYNFMNVLLLVFLSVLGRSVVKRKEPNKRGVNNHNFFLFFF